jgi:hypothetical protein
VALQGRNRNGIAFILTLDYNKFRELFQKSKAIKEKSKRNKETTTYEKQGPILYILFLIILVYGCGVHNICL